MRFCHIHIMLPPFVKCFKSVCAFIASKMGVNSPQNRIHWWLRLIFCHSHRKTAFKQTNKTNESNSYAVCCLSKCTTTVDHCFSQFRHVAFSYNTLFCLYLCHCARAPCEIFSKDLCVFSNRNRFFPCSLITYRDDRRQYIAYCALGAKAQLTQICVCRWYRHSFTVAFHFRSFLPTIQHTYICTNEFPNGINKSSIFQSEKNWMRRRMTEKEKNKNSSRGFEMKMEENAILFLHQGFGKTNGLLPFFLLAHSLARFRLVRRG